MKHLEGIVQSAHQHLSMFDSAIFPCSVFKYRSLADYQQALKAPGSFVYVTVPHAVQDFFVLAQERFSMLGTHTVYALPEAALFYKDVDVYDIQTHATEQQQKEIVDFAYSLQLVSHYYHNPVTAFKSLEVYKTWIQNSFSGYADQYAFITVEGSVAGFITLKNKEDFLSIDLLAVNPAMRSKGIGKALINYAMRYAHDKNLSLKVTTQGENIPANRLYQKAGFLVVEQQYLFFKVEQ